MHTWDCGHRAYGYGQAVATDDGRTICRQCAARDLRAGDRFAGECGGERYEVTVTAPSEDGRWIPVRYDDGVEDLVHADEIVGIQRREG